MNNESAAYEQLVQETWKFLKTLNPSKNVVAFNLIKKLYDSLMKMNNSRYLRCNRSNLTVEDNSKIVLLIEAVLKQLPRTSKINVRFLFMLKHLFKPMFEIAYRDSKKYDFLYDSNKLQGGILSTETSSQFNRFINFDKDAINKTDTCETACNFKQDREFFNRMVNPESRKIKLSDARTMELRQNRSKIKKRMNIFLRRTSRFLKSNVCCRLPNSKKLIKTVKSSMKNNSIKLTKMFDENFDMYLCLNNQYKMDLLIKKPKSKTTTENYWWKLRQISIDSTNSIMQQFQQRCTNLKCKTSKCRKSCKIFNTKYNSLSPERKCDGNLRYFVDISNNNYFNLRNINQERIKSKQDFKCVDAKKDRIPSINELKRNNENRKKILNFVPGLNTLDFFHLSNSNLNNRVVKIVELQHSTTIKSSTITITTTSTTYSPPLSTTIQSYVTHPKIVHKNSGQTVLTNLSKTENRNLINLNSLTPTATYISRVTAAPIATTITPTTSATHFLQIINSPQSINQNTRVVSSHHPQLSINKNSLKLNSVVNKNPGMNSNILQFLYKTDGKTIQLTPINSSSTGSVTAAISTTSTSTSTKPNASHNSSSLSSAIGIRSIYEETYAKFIQNVTTTPTILTNSSTISLPKFNQTFRKAAVIETATTHANPTQTVYYAAPSRLYLTSSTTTTNCIPSLMTTTSTSCSTTPVRISTPISIVTSDQNTPKTRIIQLPTSNQVRQQVVIAATGVQRQPTSVKLLSSPSVTTAMKRVDKSTLEQLREFDLVLEQVKERSTTDDPNTVDLVSQKIPVIQKANLKCEPLNKPTKLTTSTPTNVVFVSNKQPLITTAEVLSPTSIKQSQNKTNMITIVSKVPINTSETITTTTSTSVASSNKGTTLSATAQKPQEDEQTVQRIYDILAEYAEQLRNSPDLNNKPAPRRRSNPPTNPIVTNTSTTLTNSPTINLIGAPVLKLNKNILIQSMSNSNVSTSNGEDRNNLKLDEENRSETSTVQPEYNIDEDNASSMKTTRQLIITDVNKTGETQEQTPLSWQSNLQKQFNKTTVMVPSNYILPMNLMKTQQIAIVSTTGMVSGSKILTVPTSTTSSSSCHQSNQPITMLQKTTAFSNRIGTYPLIFRTFKTSTAGTPSQNSQMVGSILTRTPATTINKNKKTSVIKNNSYIRDPPILIMTTNNKTNFTLNTSNQSTVAVSSLINNNSRLQEQPFQIVANNYDNNDCADVIKNSNSKLSDNSPSINSNSQILLQMCNERKQAALEREMHLQKSLSEECEDLGVDEPSTSDLFPEADLILFDQSSQDNNEDRIEDGENESENQHRIVMDVDQLSENHVATDYDDLDEDNVYYSGSHCGISWRKKRRLSRRSHLKKNCQCCHVITNSTSTTTLSSSSTLVLPLVNDQYQSNISEKISPKILNRKK